MTTSLTVAEAVQRTGLSDKTIRRAIESGKLHALPDVRPTRIGQESFVVFQQAFLGKHGGWPPPNADEALIQLQSEIDRLDRENASLRSRLLALTEAHLLVVEALKPH
jgi:excisionase family DNA binding protein